mmetsp:Transcript_88979/g.212396  ORF Transcript_88979/g.212396 Transcript_88979/m.212396 type:complete len:205 (-) Transcript_88979:2053-2667(-)
MHRLPDGVVAPLGAVLLGAEAQAQAAACALLHASAPEVGGHHHQRVAEGHHTALRVGEAAIIQQLQQSVEDVRVRLLHLVEEHQGVGTTADSFCEGAALAVAHVPGRGPQELGDRVLLHELAHVQPDHRLRGPEEAGGQLLAQLCLAHPRGAAEHEGGDGPARVPQARPRPAQGPRHAAHGVLLSDHALPELGLQLQQPGGLSG